MRKWPALRLRATTSSVAWASLFEGPWPEQSLQVTEETESDPSAPGTDGAKVDHWNAAERDRIEFR